MLLSILIPTYNRSIFLKKNLEALKRYIYSEQIESEIEVVVSNNFSPDNTDKVIKEFIDFSQGLYVNYIHQTENVGLEKNALAVLKNAKGEYVMYLGDDDYIDYKYLSGVFEYLKKNKSTYCIIPSFRVINTEGIVIRKGRDTQLPNTIQKKGFRNCLSNSWRGHQLSGLVLKRKGLYESYIENNVGNIYPFIYLASYCCLYGETYHFTKYPVLVTDPGQQNKDWNYGKDGLLNDVFDNYIKLPINDFKKGLLELKFINLNLWRFWGKKPDELKLNEVWTRMNDMIFSPKTAISFKIIFPLFIFYKLIKIKLKTLKNN